MSDLKKENQAILKELGKGELEIQPTPNLDAKPGENLEVDPTNKLDGVRNGGFEVDNLPKEEVDKMNSQEQGTACCNNETGCGGDLTGKELAENANGAGEGTNAGSGAADLGEVV